MWVANVHHALGTPQRRIRRNVRERLNWSRVGPGACFHFDLERLLLVRSFLPALARALDDWARVLRPEELGLNVLRGTFPHQESWLSLRVLR